MPTLPFTIDAELLRELGERLVGKPHIVLAELVKNSYDADATQVTIKFSPSEDCIEVSDNGHGMTFEEFRGFWMRIGTTHKRERRSKNLGRQLTGSKGVGRLAVQFLANRMTIRTVPEGSDEWLEAKVSWEEAVKAGELTEVTVECIRNQSCAPFLHGTSIILSELKDKWEIDSVRKLASEVWWLQPPFGAAISYRDNSKDRFRVHFQSTQQDYAETFEKQMGAIKSIWIARLVGKNVNGKVTLSLQFPGEQPMIHEYSIADFFHNEGKFNKAENLNNAHFEIRIYDLSGRQKFGIKVGEAREYFATHGGVHVYDGNFRLPYYGLPTSDWLRLEYDHSHRKTVSQFFPREIQVRRALNDLPTLGRVLGVVNVNTSEEPNLKTMITRDRLIETPAYEDLVSMVRYAIDWYANETARRKIEAKKREVSSEPTSLKFERVEQVLEQYEPEIPQNVYQEIYEKVQEATITAKTNQELVLEQIGLLAPLATAGISALSYQHELKKQFTYIEDAIDRIKTVQTLASFLPYSSKKAGELELEQNLNSLNADLSSWLERAKATNSLFDYIADADNTKLRERFRAVSVIEDIAAQTSFLARGIEIDYRQLDNQLYLPKASFAEWGAIFQNVFINAFNAMLDSPHRLLHISSRSHEKSREILVQDTGQGINLQEADRFFEPFERASTISTERQALGYGGTGLGLTIVRLLADNIGCRVQFVHPQDQFRTAFSIQWRETQ
jgi:signal transduction histidine kinase